ncbi:hypothetical protein [Phaeobacter sp. 22II1-1F12B]|uniref:hypothetical protein n=1 Tax=Phaeobacter sp. 22II1-1F12B TaxID=1317111 RepID=UPI000B51EC85|nr:hypothetical protein [Phaeobacter sp. 22II1-1F12B]OWU68771.1 hypothetical protein ATO1_25040 [Phaeobacter sp. 22II1-1F12B]
MSDENEKPDKSIAMPTLTVDWEAYGHFLEESNLSDEAKRDFIETIWSIVVGFVDLGFAVRSPEEGCGQQATPNAEKGSDVVQSLADQWVKATKPDNKMKKGSVEQSGPKLRGRTP